MGDDAPLAALSGNVTLVRARTYGYLNTGLCNLVLFRFFVRSEAPHIIRLFQTAVRPGHQSSYRPTQVGKTITTSSARYFNGVIGA